ncbi:MAG: hypothetical protein QF926_13465 [Alphaproteobacteria bacterium]|nr:hypothetical protein [Alphaproteobacteria bacterium]
MARKQDRRIWSSWIMATILLLAGGFGPAGADEAVRVTLVSDRSTMGIDDQVRLTLTVEAPVGKLIVFARVVGAIGPFEIVDQTESGPDPAGPGRHKWRREYLLKTEQVGAHAIPPFAIYAHETTGKPNTACYYFLNCDRTTPAPSTTPPQISSPSLTVTVTSVLEEDASLTAPRDIAPIVDIPPPPLSIWWWVAGAAARALALAAAIRGWARPRPAPIAPAGPARPAHAIALAALEQLRTRGLIDGRRSDEFHMRLSGILRHYAVWRFELQAPRQTTEEFLDAAADADELAGGQNAVIGALLRGCDLVKFARHRPGPDPMRNALAKAERFVTETADARVLVPREATLDMP